MYYITTQKNNASKELAKNVVLYLRQKKGVIAQNLKESGIIISIGDDNFLLKTFREIKNKAVLGISPTSSFLSQANAGNFKEYIDIVEKKKFSVARRSRLQAFSEKNSTNALNEIAIFPSKSASLFRYTLLIDDELFWKDSADGFIVSTPTGSTGYNFSAGGPVAVNDPKVFVLTPINSLDKSHSSIVVNDSAVIKLTNIQSSSLPVIVVDGKIRVNLKSNSITIKKSDSYAHFVEFSKMDSVDIKLKKRNQKPNINKLADMPPSAKLIYKILATEGEMTQKEIINESMLPARTVRHTLQMLVDIGIVSKKPHLADTRQMIYNI